MSYKLYTSDEGGIRLFGGHKTEDFPSREVREATTNPLVGGIVVLWQEGPQKRLQVIRKGIREDMLEHLLDD